MAEAFVQLLLDNLSSLIQGEIGLIMGVDDEMKNLSSTLTTIQAVLEDAEEKQLESKAIRNWLCKLNDLTYEIDDILDVCATEVSKLKYKNIKSSRYLQNIFYRYKIGRRVKEVTKELNTIAIERAQYHLHEMTVDRQIKVSSIRETCSILDESHPVYGRGKEREKIVDILVNQTKECRELSILPIIGIGGLGKTTLAQEVFKNDRVTAHFDIKVWVCVSFDFDHKTLIKAILESVSGKGSASDLVHLDTLQRRLMELLNQKRYLLVLDDVWNEDQDKWSMLKSFLACGSTGASIIVTTRIKSVADIMSTFPAHHLTGLSDEDCWLLFKQRAFGQKEEHPNLEAIGKLIVKKCGGVPLAAKTLGGLLRLKRKEKEWIHVKDSEIWNLPQAETSILPALRLSYNHLPLRFRQCFAYCAIFPKDMWIEKEELILLWATHGYISSIGAMEVEDVGNGIWDELVWRCLFQDVIIKRDGQTVFKIHDLVHDLAQSIMENKVLGTQVEINNRSATITKIREVNLKNHIVAFPTSMLPNMDLTSALKNYSRLRVLNASRTNIDDLPYSVGKLKHLRYLNLSYTEIRSLPKAICSLWNLKILNLNYCDRLVGLPKNIRYMRNLRHLFLDWCKSFCQMPPNIGELTSLRTLSVFIVGHEKGTQLKELQFLDLGGKLFIEHLERVENLVDARKANLAEKRNLRDLGLIWNGDNGTTSREILDEKVLEVLEPPPNLETLAIGGFRGNCFPPWMRSSTLGKIVRIDISNCPNCLCLPKELGELPLLKRLELTRLAVQYIIEDDIQGVKQEKSLFPALEELGLTYLPNLKGLSKEDTGEMFPNLRELKINGSSPLMLPRWLSLKNLTATKCSNETLISVAKLKNLTDLNLSFDESVICFPKEILQNLTNVESLFISNLQQHHLPEEGLQFAATPSQKCLRNLFIWGSDTLAYLPKRWLPHLTALEGLFIVRCPEFVEFPEETKCLKSLKSLHLSHLPKMICLPESLQYIRSLKSLSLSNLSQLNSLPNWLGNYTTLDSLYIHECPNITSLPPIIRAMENLKYIYIENCPELERRCEKGKGEDWHKIAHIWNLRIVDRMNVDQMKEEVQVELGHPSVPSIKGYRSYRYVDYYKKGMLK
ncbi:hypothetical protein RD792_005854 [Penstemon davidsonii]|uniref:Disease resistance protein RGA3 n=1 Tax=Penstemon davidsonii TaxID=160366 RepID=A0ABR0DE40_9LAMI|nr:hypothetical protein RD792_005854 [Penstemon davidsonii]